MTEAYVGLRPNRGAVTEALLAILRHHPITSPAARLTGELNREQRCGPHTPSTQTLLTDNVKDSPMEALSLYPLPEG